MKKSYRKSQKSRKRRKLRKRQSYRAKQKGGEVGAIPGNTLMLLKENSTIDSLPILKPLSKVLNKTAF